ncbi:peptidylprolyl isomerase [Acidisphaera sp. S103]|uniref:peptidylprolyl isomerase n=1 Tax=Acidisphaera sp. S103 TaxID=1747223 RepID=UPI00131B0822|nr:peptidylprolyl isomerase [Acidisphaera sp. S103]
MRTPAWFFCQGFLLACVLALPIAALAQSSASPAPGLGIAPAGAGMSGDATTPQQGPADPVVASVEGHLIYLSDLGEASKTLPENLRGMPFETIYPVLLDRMVDHEALVMMAERKGLDQQKQVQKDIQAATDRILEGAYLGQVAAPQVTEQAIQARYNQEFANHPATEEVRARHILVTTEAEARKVLEDLKKGADFATVARLVSKDPDAAKGGDLGFFRREQVWPAFADVAFSLQPGQIAPNPVKNEFGWHVIKVEEKRLVAPPSFSDIHDQLKQQLLAAAVQRVIANAKGQLAIHRFNLDGSEIDNGPKLDVAAPVAPPSR